MIEKMENFIYKHMEKHYKVKKNSRKAIPIIVMLFGCGWLLAGSLVYVKDKLFILNSIETTGMSSDTKSTRAKTARTATQLSIRILTKIILSIFPQEARGHTRPNMMSGQ